MEIMPFWLVYIISEVQEANIFVSGAIFTMKIYKFHLKVEV